MLFFILRFLKILFLVCRNNKIPMITHTVYCYVDDLVSVGNRVTDTAYSFNNVSGIAELLAESSYVNVNRSAFSVKGISPNVI